MRGALYRSKVTPTFAGGRELAPCARDLVDGLVAAGVDVDAFCEAAGVGNNRAVSEFEFEKVRLAIGCGHRPIDMECQELRQMGANPLRPLRCKRLGGRDAAMKRENPANTMLLDGRLERDLVGDLARFNRVAIDDDLAAADEIVMDHFGRHDGYDDLVGTDDPLPGRIRERQCVSGATVDARIIHRVDEPGISLFVFLSDVVVAWCCR